MERILQSRWFTPGVMAFFLVLVFALYGNTFNSSFHFDDTPSIVKNYELRDLRNLPSILAGQRGVTMATFALNYAVGELSVTGYHIVNTLIHALNTILVYLFLFYTLSALRDDDGGELWSKKIALYAALLFATHPVQTQSITYIVQRMESLSALFFLLSMILFIRGVKCEGLGKRCVLFVGVVLGYILAFKSKEVAITLPAVVLVYDYCFIAKGSLRDMLGRWPLYLVLLATLVYFAISTIIPLGGFNDLSPESSGLIAAAPAMGASLPSAGFNVESISSKEYLFTQLNVVVYYIALLIVPINQNLDYDFPVARGFFSTPEVNAGTVLNLPVWPPVVSFIILMAIVGLAIYLFMLYRKTGRVVPLVVAFSIFWFFTLLSPTSSFVPIVDVIFEHRLYLASLGFFLAFALAFDWVFSLIGKRMASRSGG